MQDITWCQVPNWEYPAALLRGVTCVAVSTDDERRIAWTHRLIGTEPKPEGSEWRESGKYVGVLDVGWVKRTFGQGDKPLSGTALSYWRKKGIPLEHVQRMIEELRALLPDTEKEAAPSMTRRLLAGVIALEKKAGVSEDELSAAQNAAAAAEEALRVDRLAAAELEASRRKASERKQGQGGGQSAGSPGSTRRKP